MSHDNQKDILARRSFLTQSSWGLGAVALAELLGAQGTQARAGEMSEGVVKPLHFPARAKRVIFLCMAGGPSHLETFDYKPALAKMDGQPMPSSFTQGQPIAQLQGQQLKCLGPQFSFHVSVRVVRKFLMCCLEFSPLQMISASFDPCTRRRSIMIQPTL